MNKYLVQAWERYQACAAQSHCEIPRDAQFLRSLWYVLASSDYLTTLFCQEPSLPIEMMTKVNKAYDKQDYVNEWQFFSTSVNDEISLMRALRQFNRKSMARIAWRELLNLCSFNTHIDELSSLADVCIIKATEYIYQQALHKWGTPCNEQGQIQPFMVVAVGKLGAGELNFSSDVDLIFTYPEDGATVGTSRKITNQQFFTKVGQQLIKVLSEVTMDGFVYRVDMRLRPHGQSGNLVLNFNAIENYYQYHGRDWERYALIKARVITGESAAPKLYSLLQPFVYRRYLDYGAFESLREMRDLVLAQIKRKQIKKNIKLGPGGIRQIEFLAQAFQLIRGGQNRQFQHRQLLIILSRLGEAGFLPITVCQELEKAYIFLRKCEHRLQIMQNQQTHILPKSALDRARLYFTMGLSSWVEFQHVLKRHTHQVETHFNNISSTPPNEKTLAHKGEGDFIWSNLGDSSSIKLLEKLGYQDAKTVVHLLTVFKESRTCQNLKKHASARLDKIIGVLILSIARQSNSTLVMERMLRLMQSIARRSAYLALLLEKPKALEYLIKIAHTSDWILSLLCTYPVLLDELLSPPLIEEVTDKHYLELELSQRLNWLLPTDLEGQMDHLRQFKLACYLHVALLEMESTHHKIDVSAVLNNIVEIILNKIYDLSLDFMIRHYQLNESAQTLKEKIPFGIVAYGKLGACELSYQSDLDLVFLYNTYNECVLQGKHKSITYDEFSLRLAQRIIHMLSTHTSAGTLYEVDVRLRPGGSAGLLVSHFEAFKKYLHEQAWTWEHQALVKARMVVGEQLLFEAFEQCREAILIKKREPIILAKEISKMREKMHEQHRFIKNEIKMVKGGLCDIDFIAQYFMLLKSHQCTSLIKMRSSMCILQQLQATSLIEPSFADLLIGALDCYQRHIRQKIFQPEFEFSQDKALNDYLARVCDLWDRIFSGV